MELKRHIIIEGPDGAGKTTLARQLAHLTGKAYHHEGPPPAGADVFQHYMGLLIRNEPTVFDRLYAGETIYGPILRGKSGLSQDEKRLLDGHAIVHARTIYVNPGYDVCKRNWLGRAMLGKELILREAIFEETYDRFQDIAHEFDFKYNYTEFTPA